MAGTLNTNGAVISGTAAFFENFDVIRFSAAQPLAPVSLRVTSGGLLDLTLELNFAPVNIVGFSGGSFLLTGGGADTLTGGAGNDTLNGGGGIDIFRGGAGNDTYVVTAGDLFFENANQGTDTVYCSVDFSLPVNFENVVLQGAAFAVNGNGSNNVILGTSGANAIAGLGGNDRLDGGLGNDTLDGGTGNDTILVGRSASVYVGGTGVDTLDLSVGGISRQVNAGLVRDGAVTSSETGFERFAFGAGADSYSDAGSIPVTVTGGGGPDTILTGSGADRIEGGDGDDLLLGGAGIDTVLGGAGNDRFYLEPAPGGDLLNGGSGTDTLLLQGFGISRVTLNAAASIEIVDGNAAGARPMLGTDGNDQFDLSGVTLFSGVTAVELRAGDDRHVGAIAAEMVLGGTGNDTLSGGTGNDLLYGETDSDTINGQAGNDFLSGGSGADSFLFNTTLNASTNVDQIADFSAFDDTIRLDDAVFRGLPTGLLRAADFVIGGTAATTAQNIIYNNLTGDLFYDPDGLGGVAQVRFAQIERAPAVTAADFLIV